LRIKANPLTPAAFAPFGDVLDSSGDPDRIINRGGCARYHDRARLDFGPDGRAGISIFRAEPSPLPHSLDLVERHPDGSQAFLPLDRYGFLVVAAPDDNGRPGLPQAFVSAPGQGINFRRGTWHGVLTPLEGNGLFAVIDRIGDTRNLEEFRFKPAYLVYR